MGSIDDGRFNIAEIYARYREIILSTPDRANARESLSMLSRSLELSELTSDTILNETLKLMSSLKLSADSLQFSCFYKFVFFICREKGQKNISLSRAISAWRLVLNGRFRLLNKWCEFVEKHHRHSISEDTWQQVLSFSQYVHENLEGYDPEAAWPVLIDEFVDYMCRTNRSSNCNTQGLHCTNVDTKVQLGLSKCFTGLDLPSGVKRKFLLDSDLQFGNSPKHQRI